MTMTKKVILAGLLLAVVLAASRCGSYQKPAPAQPEQPAEVGLPPPPSPWHVDTDTSPLTGEITTVAESGPLVVRLRGKKLDCYIATEQFLETVENMHSRTSLVRYRFDQGPLVNEYWTISDDNTALFAPGGCSPFLRKLSKAETLVLEYKPADVIAQTTTINVSQFSAWRFSKALTPNPPQARAGLALDPASFRAAVDTSGCMKLESEGKDCVDVAKGTQVGSPLQMKTGRDACQYALVNVPGAGKRWVPFATLEK
jgi:hypothetical protein